VRRVHLTREMQIFLIGLLSSLLAIVSSGQADQACDQTTMSGSKSEILTFATTDELSRSVGKHVAQVAQAAKGKDKFLIALSGGSLPKVSGVGGHCVWRLYADWWV